MNNKSTIFLLSAMVLVVGIVGGLVGAGISNKSITGGDFPGGIVPTQLFTGNASTNSVSPITSNIYATAGTVEGAAVNVGGTLPQNGDTLHVWATSTFPASSMILGPITAATSTTSTVVTVYQYGLAVGDSCSNVAYAGAPTSTSFGIDAFITGVNNVTTTASSTASATVTFWNGASTNVTVNSSSLKLNCVHGGV